MKKYLYSGPLSGVSLKEGDDIIDIMLIPDGVVSMPPDNEYTKRLIRKGWLREVKMSSKETNRRK